MEPRRSGMGTNTAGMVRLGGWAVSLLHRIGQQLTKPHRHITEYLSLYLVVLVAVQRFLGSVGASLT